MPEKCALAPMLSERESTNVRQAASHAHATHLPKCRESFHAGDPRPRPRGEPAFCFPCLPRLLCSSGDCYDVGDREGLFPAGVFEVLCISRRASHHMDDPAGTGLQAAKRGPTGFRLQRLRVCFTTDSENQARVNPNSGSDPSMLGSCRMDERI